MLISLSPTMSRKPENGVSLTWVMLLLGLFFVARPNLQALPAPAPEDSIQGRTGDSRINRGSAVPQYSLSVFWKSSERTNSGSFRPCARRTFRL